MLDPGLCAGSRHRAGTVEFTDGMDQAADVPGGRAHLPCDPETTIFGCSIALIGQAATHIPESVRDSHPDRTIPWRSIVGARNVIMHQYLGRVYDLMTT